MGQRFSCDIYSFKFFLKFWIYLMWLCGLSLQPSRCFWWSSRIRSSAHSFISTLLFIIEVSPTLFNHVNHGSTRDWLGSLPFPYVGYTSCVSGHRNYIPSSDPNRQPFNGESINLLLNEWTDQPVDTMVRWSRKVVTGHQLTMFGTLLHSAM